MIRTLIMVLVLQLGTSYTLMGQQDRSRSTDDSDAGPISTLLEIRTQLALTDEQVARLEQIDVQMDQQNEPLVKRMTEVRRSIRGLGDSDAMTPEQRALFESYVAEARSLLRQIQRNNRSAMEQVGEVLTEAQETEIRRLLRERNDDDNDNNNRRGQNSRTERVPASRS